MITTCERGPEVVESKSPKRPNDYDLRTVSESCSIEESQVRPNDNNLRTESHHVLRSFFLRWILQYHDRSEASRHWLSATNCNNLHCDNLHWLRPEAPRRHRFHSPPLCVSFPPFSLLSPFKFKILLLDCLRVRGSVGAGRTPPYYRRPAAIHFDDVLPLKTIFLHISLASLSCLPFRRHTWAFARYTFLVSIRYYYFSVLVTID